MPVERLRVGVENDGAVEQRRDPADAAAYVAAPELEMAAPFLAPVAVQVEKEVDAPPPRRAVRMPGEVGVDVQVAAARNLMEPATFQTRVRKEPRDARQPPEPAEERRGVQRLDDARDGVRKGRRIVVAVLPLVD